ncbi:HNH endonuclease [Phormidesmis priestleyi ULC007]|uniref:HNH endonuclease n=1 Tax=Phormidesmis priestleyi ULC007 TaxID=1920490 RepID=A0A2T1D864_9CYAN|nr:HNH endonuclease [Phormidesmis priestleyi]PSB16682.1 HNH endonuclease [Phormidesmis priestleyi ULC007]PZO47617.1 MAG: HNH endonuclease [Phormidesmis priestleyi]
MTWTKRQHPALWHETCKQIWQRDEGRCQGPHCQHQPLNSLSLKNAHIDHILEVSKGGSDANSNLRTLCRRCHCLRSSIAHQGMIGAALSDGVIPPNWRTLVWEG